VRADPPEDEMPDARSPNLSRRAFAGLGLAAASGLAGCATPDPLEAELPPMGDFALASAIVVVDNVKMVPPSRRAAPERIREVVAAELTRRFGAYDGTRPYYLAVNVDGYALAPPGIPIVLTPKSVLVVTANLWSVEPQEKLRGPEQILTFEGADTLLIGSGLVKDADEQLTTLARNTAAKIQAWLLREPGTFGLPTG
jgi:hypothetical protein